MRREDWHEKMWHAIEQHREVPFDWATYNCCTFAARVWDAMTDGDTVTQVAACHPDELGALRHIRDCGGLGPALERIYGPTVPGRAQRGDLVLIDTDNGPAAGIWVGSTALVRGPVGLVAYPRSAILARWVP